MDPEARPPVMADVARVAGVSHQTVSRVLNGASHVREETRDRVLAAIRQLDYRPNSAARALVTRRSQTLGVVSFGSVLYGPASMLDGIEQAARSAGYFVSVASLRSLDSRSVQEAVDRLRDQGVEGIAVIAPQTSAVSAIGKLSTVVPVVAVGSGSESRVPVVAIDNESGALAATRHLLDLGHTTVHHVAGPPGWLETTARQNGWRKALKAAGAPVPPVRSGDWSARSGYEAGLGLAADPAVTAVFCANDHMALGLLRALHESGRAIPGDISVVGFDDISEAAYFSPPLTTVRQDFGELGRRALELLVEELNGAGHSRQHILLPPEMVLRRSTGPVPSR
ncbi:LacI family DNA-binding transcriptional regulator [Streptomyces sp. RKAG337]|uniref:LacI family DNA-binding transcriptional regulator n=1 Tax=Streptomyces sp. RKAG337 TaxID=2893404 RepID=UPI002033A268|nr:LacI family DNA-binding transcriptional regulator [Streptomyces sp. RKAG337]MCM2430663.1 LacI family DNA-binding transcriptional regulator [Streptomyces sp. RKAG337]